MRPNPEQVRRVACVGTGTIGAGWTALFLARGFDVLATDPAPGAETRLRYSIDEIWPRLEALDLVGEAGELEFTDDLEHAVRNAEFIQENALDREDLKINLFADIDSVAPPDTIISSSSSQFLPTALASKCKHPQRCMVGHPFAPSYLMPLVEIVGGEKTDSTVMDWAEAFYRSLGKKILRLKKEVDWYVANRLQLVVAEEGRKLVEAGVCDFADVDAAMIFGPGMRWAFAGPMMCSHLGGGKGGIRHMIEHFGWPASPELKDRAIGTVEDIAGHLTMEEIEQWRDDNLIAMLKALKPLPT